MIPGSGRSPGEGIGYPLQYSWASLMAQSVKNLTAMWVQSLGWEGPLEENMATHPNICAWRIPMNREAWWATVHVVTESDISKHIFFFFAAKSIVVYLFLNVYSLMYIPLYLMSNPVKIA